ncbi:helix-turn-helix domain-containing protein [Pseudorhodoplanes sp.]|uniref:helix-turn-helix domain-containing protein n=1 Tax=Pseudorhodoplanes sp. TaxID=1934341 RepID=UPI00391A703F
MQKIPSDVGRVLERLRKEAGPKQSDLAEALGVHPSRVSRWETGAAQAAAEEIVEYLKAIGGDAAALYQRILATRWVDIDPPDPWHPDAVSLVDAMTLLQRLDEQVINDPALPQSLSGQAQFLRERLIASARYLSNLTHHIAFIGKIGDGKTTALCFLTGLVRPSRKQPRDLRDECLLATQRSRTTLCEAAVRGEPVEKGPGTIRFRISIEPQPNEEIYRLVREYALDLWNSRSGEKRPPEESRGPSIEVERALRNMAKLKTEEVKHPDGRVESRREESELARNASSVEELQSAIAERLQLFKRTERELVWTGVSEIEGRNWLKKTYSDINLGNAPTVSLPARVRVTVPFSIMEGSQFEIEAIDTKGIDGAATRPDIQAILDDSRSLPVLCTTLGDAPGPHYDSLFTQLADTGALQQFAERAVLLVLDKEKEALTVADDSTGLDVETVDQGRRIKRDHARRELERRGLGAMPILFFNASEDDPGDVNQQLLARISEIRRRESGRLERIAEAVNALIDNRAQQSAEAELREAVRHLETVLDQIRDLAPSVRPFFEALLRQIVDRGTHQKSLLASVSRAGSWWNFDVYHALGSGAAEDANLRAREAYDQIRIALKNLIKDKKYASCQKFLIALSESAEKWFENFLAGARTVAAEVCRPVLSEAGDLWTRCEADYRTGFKGHVQNHLKKWFEEQAPRSMHAAVEEGLQRAWTNHVIRPLEGALGTAKARNDKFDSF